MGTPFGFDTCQWKHLETPTQPTQFKFLKYCFYFVINCQQQGSSSSSSSSDTATLLALLARSENLLVCEKKASGLLSCWVEKVLLVSAAQSLDVTSQVSPTNQRSAVAKRLHR